MTWTFDPSLASTRDQVRAKVGDVITADQLLSDEQLDAILSTRLTVAAAAVEAVRQILAKLARDIDRNAVGISTSRSQKTTHFADVLARLERELALAGAPYVGGVSKASATSRESSTDYPQPAFAIGRDDHP